MEMESLKKWRLFIPGILTLILLYPFRQDAFDPESFHQLLFSTHTLTQSVAALVVGLIYERLNLRYLFLRPSHLLIKHNIQQRLLKMCGPDPTISAAASALTAGSALMHLFYRVIDSDPTLTAKSKRVYFNGLVWTSAVDLGALALLFCLVYWLTAIFVSPRPAYVWSAVALGVLAFLIDYWFLPGVVHRHITLSNHQLEHMELFLRPSLCAELKAIAASTVTSTRTEAEF